MPVRLCSSPGCGNPVSYRGRCVTCARTRERDIDRAGRAVYRSRRWQILRRHVLLEQPLCPGVLGGTCGAVAEHVHHIRDIADGGDPWALANLVGLCAPCHSRITRMEQATR